MQPTRLNFLPPKKKAHLNNVVTFQATKSLLEILLFVASIAGIVLLLSQLTLQKHFNDLTVNLVALNNKDLSVGREMKQINKRLLEINRIQDETILWTPLIHNIFTAIPPGIVLNRTAFDITTKKILLSGVATSRDDLLILQQQLGNLPCETYCIKEPAIPPSLLTQKENISFTLEGIIEIE